MAGREGSNRAAGGFQSSALPGFRSVQASHTSNQPPLSASATLNTNTAVTVNSGQRPRQTQRHLSNGSSATIPLANPLPTGRFSSHRNSTGHLANNQSSTPSHRQTSAGGVLNSRSQSVLDSQSSNSRPISRTPQSVSGNTSQSQHIGSRVRRQQNGPYPQPNEMMQLVSKTKAVEERLKRVEEQNISIKECLDSVKDLLEKHLQQSFKIKGGVYEASLKAECAKLFCMDMRREVPLPKVQAVVSKVLKSEAKDKHKFGIALSFCRERLNQFRSDEKRKVLGVGPYAKQQSQKNPTDILADNIMKATTAPSGVRSQYIKNLSLLRKFVREAKPNSDKLHEQFRMWLDENPVLTGDLDQIVAEDQLIDYAGDDPMLTQAHDNVQEMENNYSSTNQDQQVDQFLQSELPYQEWDNSENLSPGIGGGVCGEVVHGENVANML